MITVSATLNGADCTTIGAACRQAQAGQTVKVLDNGRYEENTTIDVPAGVTLFAPRVATLVAPAGLAALQLKDAAGAKVRGLRITDSAKNSPLLRITGRSGGAVVDDVQFVSSGGTEGWVISCEALAIDDMDKPLVVRKCKFVGGHLAIGIDGVQPEPTKTLRCQRVRIEDNEILNADFGIGLRGRVEQILIAGNRIVGAGGCGIHVYEYAEEWLYRASIVNNTFIDCRIGLNVLIPDEEIADRRVQFRSNLLIGTRESDVTFIRKWSLDSEAVSRDGRGLLGAWRVGYNWREGREPAGGAAVGWVPPGPADAVRERLEVASRDPRSADFLRPAADSPLAAGGAGVADPALPRYAGAVPPPGTKPWDWAAAWAMWNK